MVALLIYPDCVVLKVVVMVTVVVVVEVGRGVVGSVDDVDGDVSACGVT